MFVISRKNLVAVMLLITSLIACSTRDRSRILQRGANNGVGTSAVTAKFDNELQRLKSTDSTMKKPTPEQSLLDLNLNIIKAYNTATTGNKNQQNSIQSMSPLFNYIVVAPPVGKEESPGVISLKIQSYTRKGGSLNFEFSGDIDLKKGGAGTLNATTTPQAVSNLVDDSQMDPAVITTTSTDQVATPPPTKNPTTTGTVAAPVKPYQADVTCLDSVCTYMVVKFIDNTKRAFFPLLAKTIQLKDQVQAVKLKLVGEVMNDLKSAADAKGIKISGSGNSISLALPDSKFQLNQQTLISIATQQAQVTLSVSGLNTETLVNLTNASTEVAVEFSPKN